MSRIVEIAKRDFNGLLIEQGFTCDCGKHHGTPLKEVIIKAGALEQAAEVVKKYGASKVFLIADKNTYAAAGERVASLLDQAGIPKTVFIFDDDYVQPTDTSLDKVLAGFDASCDLVLGVGSGTINDISKLAAKETGVRYISVATAPSMDGFVSDTSSMVMQGVKVSVPSTVPLAVIADLDVLAAAPRKLLQAGFGDIMAKYVSTCEWRISHLVTDEYYCEEIASLMRLAVHNCVSHVEDLAKGDHEAVRLLMESLILAGIAMSFAGTTRPASGVEHYFSHLWDMRHLEFDTPKSLHGLQTGIGTILSLDIYDQIKKIVPDEAHARQYAQAFDLESWYEVIRSYLGKSGERLVELDKKERKYDKEAHAERLSRIINNWDQILRIIEEELPCAEELRKSYEIIGCPVSPVAIGISYCDTRRAFLLTKDIRFKYNASMLLWDLGKLEEVAQSLWQEAR